jgi:hypothetical protein
MADLGTHAVQVWVRQPGATANYEAYAGTGTFSVATKPFTVGALVANGRSPFSTGQSINWTAVINPIDVTNALEYQFWLLNKATGTWTSVRGYAPGNTFTFSPDWEDAGNYAIQVWARYIGSTVRYAGWAAAEFKVDRNIGTFAANKVFPVAPGTTITWTADAGSSASPLEYRFYLLSSGVWQMAQDYSTTNTFRWTTDTSDIGTHAMQVWVKSSSSSANYDAWKGTGYFDISSTRPTLIAVNFSSPPQSGSATTISATASGGYAGPLEFRFWVYSSASGWTVIREWGTSANASWTPPAPGPYSIQVWVRSAGSTANYEDWKAVSPVIVP